MKLIIFWLKFLLEKFHSFKIMTNISLLGEDKYLLENLFCFLLNAIYNNFLKVQTYIIFQLTEIVVYLLPVWLFLI